MNLTRRDFLRWASLSTVGAVACNIFDQRQLDIQSPSELPEDLVAGEDNWYATLCGQCPEQEGILVRVFQGRAKKVQGNPLYPTNQGKQSVRCDGGLQAVYHPDRIVGPLLRTGPRGSGQYAPIPWADALDRLRGELLRRRNQRDPDTLLTITEPLRGHLGNLTKGFTEAYVGRHMVFEAMENTVLRRAVRDVFGQDALPHFDIGNARCLLSFGADFLSTWISPTQYAREYGQFRQSEGRSRGHFIHVDPRFSMTAASADEWIPVRPGTEGILALSIAYVMMKNAQQWGIDPAVVDAMTWGQGLEALGAYDPERSSGDGGLLPQVGLPPSLHDKSPSQVVEDIARCLATDQPGLVIGGGEAAAHPNGLFNLKAIFALNYLVDSVNKPGGVIFNPAPPIPGLDEASAPGTLAHWQNAAERIRNSDVKVLLVHGANPVHGLPSDVGFWHALNGGQDANDLYVVSFSSFMDETTEMADLVLPVRTPMEEWGDDVPEPGPGYQVVGVRQPVVNPLPGLDPRSFADILLTLAQELDLDALDTALGYNTFQEMLRDGAQGLYDLNRGSLGDVPRSKIATFEEFWRTLLQKGFWRDEATTNTAAPPPPPDLAALADRQEGDEAPPGAPPGTYYLVPFASNSLLDGRGAHLPWLQAAPDPLTTVAWQTWLEISLQDAAREGLEMGDLVGVTLDGGPANRKAIAVTYPHPAIPPGVVAMPVGQGHTSSLRYAQDKGSNVLSLLIAEKEKETQAFAWAASRVRLQKEGTRVRVTKFEAAASSYQAPHERVVRVINE